jgi:hypothetical protein
MRLKPVFGATLAIMLWCIACSAWWFFATRDDYARLAVARACHGLESPVHVSAAQCAAEKPSDLLAFKAKIDAKARDSRLAAAAGGAVAAGLLMLVNRRLRMRARRDAI